MNYLLQLEQQETITIAEALNFSQQLTQQYLSMLHNLMMIRKNIPVNENEPVFRSAQNGETSTPQLYQLLKQLQVTLFAIESRLTAKMQEISGQDFLKLEYSAGKKLLSELEQTINQCESIYENHSYKFAMILRDYIKLEEIIRQKLPTMNMTAQQQEQNIILEQANEAPELVLEPDEKLIYIRVFNRKMPTLNTSKEGLQWIKPLFDSVKFAEKHGLAIYEHEADVIRSLKGDAYGYVTVKIKKEQDITKLRPQKIDPALGCYLLTITPIELNNMIKLTYHNVEYWIRDGRLHKAI